MPPKKRRGGKTNNTRKTKAQTKPKTKSSQQDEEPEQESGQESVAEESSNIKTHKKFGKFRCLNENIDGGDSFENKESPQRSKTNSPQEELQEYETVDCDESVEISEQLDQLEVSEKADPIQIDEIAENLQELVIPEENVESDIVVEYVSEEVIPVFEEEEEVFVEAANENLDDKPIEETIIEENVEENEPSSTVEEVSVKEDSNDKETESDSPSSDNKSESKKTEIDKFTPSRKSTRISLKKNRLLKAIAPKETTVATKAKKGKQTSSEEPTDESSNSKSEESTDDKTDSSGEKTGETNKVVKKARKVGQKSTLKRKVIKKDAAKSTQKSKGTKKTVKLKVVPKGRLLKKKKIKCEEGSIDSTKEDENSIRRSNRIKTISSQKKKSSKGKGLVKKESKDDNSDNSNSGNNDEKSSSKESLSFVTPTSSSDSDRKPVKVKSRWRRSSELEMSTAQSKLSPAQVEIPIPPTPVLVNNEKKPSDEEVERRLKQFIHLKENNYLTERISCKEAKKMTCDCFLTEEEIEEGEFGCGEDCLNRLLMIECGSLCTVGERCTNKRFQRGQFAPCEAFRTDKKGLGIRASANIPYGEFILEYVGEVLDPDEFDTRAAEYSKDKNQHYYFMSLRADAVIDATQKGNISRFINHSCDPNAETQKWTVNGELRIGFFSKRTILAGEEITFDYQFQRYGKEAQKCFCEAATCRGWLGEEPEDEDDEEEDEDEEEEEEEEGSIVEEKVITEKKEVIPEVIKDVQVTEEKPEGEIVPPAEAVKVEASPKKEKKPKPKKKTRKDIFEDLDLDDEIETLQTTGLKNQAHTLKLSRLMVRAKEIAQRTKLLKLLKRGELPCRRLFLDYHGLRLLHGWMTDAQHQAKTDEKVEYLRLEILQTLAMLPIPNKTMLQDSKVLPTVEKWAVCEKPVESPTESESNSPKSEIDVVPVEKTQPEVPKDKIEEQLQKFEEDEFEIRRSVGMDVAHRQIYKQITSKNIIEELSTIFDDDMDISPISFDEKEPNSEIKEVTRVVVPAKENEYDVVEEILALASKLLEEWASLKEVFRIPKKERIEQMKEHEREADKRYKAISLEQENLERKNRENRYRSLQRSRSDVSDRSRKSDRTLTPISRISKHERRKLFAMQVEQAEVDRRRKQQELWRQHVKNCMMMGTDPRFTAPFDPSRGIHCIWNPQIGQWQMFNQNVPIPMTNTNFPYIPPHGLPPQPSLPPRTLTTQVNIPPTSLPPPPNIIHNLPTSQALQHNFPPISTNMPPPSPHTNIPPPTTAPITTLPPPNLSIPPPSNIPPPQSNIPPSHTVSPQTIPTNNLPTNLQHLNLNSQTIVTTTSNIPQGMVPPNIVQPNMPPASMGAMPPMPNIPAMPSIPYQEDPSQVKFMGPIPPPAKLPPKWKCAKDKYGRPYYYHIKIRKSQWEPPEFPIQEEVEYMSETSSSSDTSSLSSESSSDDSDSDDIDDTRLMLEIRNKFKRIETQKKLDFSKKEECKQPESPASVDESKEEVCDVLTESKNQDTLLEDTMETESVQENEEETISSLDKRLMEELGLVKSSEPPAKKRRVGLVQEIIISPRTEEDRLQFKEDVKRYKQNKEKLRKQKEIIVQQTKKPKPSTSGTSTTTSSKVKEKTSKKKISIKTKLKEMEANSEATKKIKETFRSTMASVMVNILNAYRKPDCKEGKITNTEDFKHLARKLTHFVMLKELKHCQKIEDLTCTESVKAKAKEFVRKYMSKFGEIYQRPADDLENY